RCGNDASRADPRINPRSHRRGGASTSVGVAGNRRCREHRENAGSTPRCDDGLAIMSGRGVIVAAPRSGSGKTAITVAIIAALSRRGVSVRVAKAGPDYIDLAFHAAAAQHPGFNLDSWAMPPALLDTLVGDAALEADLVIIEGVLGLFDGVP